MAELIIGTRGSPLALVQANETRRLLAAAGVAASEEIAIKTIRTSGDRITDRPLSEAGGKGLFTKEIDEALLSGAVNLAVHSAKDMPTRLPDGITIAACLAREDVRDAFLSNLATRIDDLPEGARIGTSSLRRRALALKLRPDLRPVDLRGNVDTRLRKLEAGVADATLLAVAGLKRLGLADRATSLIDTANWLPAIGQGVIAITCRTNDATTRAWLARIDDRAASLALAAERAFLDSLDGSCRTPIGGLAEIEADRISFRGIIVRPDGAVFHEAAREGAVADGPRLGAEAGAELKRRGGPDFFSTG
jgi:hydroxymethylbilane synthase